MDYRSPIEKFIKVTGKEPKYDDWVDVMKYIVIEHSVDGHDFERKVFHAKRAIVSYWQSKKKT
jgi:hypothetical protein